MAIDNSNSVIARADEILNGPSKTVQIEQPTNYSLLGNKREYDRNLELIGHVVAFEVGWCSDYDKYLVASACYNRMVYWYGGDAETMICDGNDEYYYMYPDYVWMDECHGYSFSENYDEIMDIVWKAVKNPADIYYWDSSDSQGEWAELVEITEAGYYYR